MKQTLVLVVALAASFAEAKWNDEFDQKECVIVLEDKETK